MKTPPNSLLGRDGGGVLCIGLIAVVGCTDRTTPTVPVQGAAEGVKPRRLRRQGPGRLAR